MTAQSYIGLRGHEAGEMRPRDEATGAPAVRPPTQSTVTTAGYGAMVGSRRRDFHAGDVTDVRLQSVERTLTINHCALCRCHANSR